MKSKQLISDKCTKPKRRSLIINLPRCNVCGEYYTILDLLQKHMETHNKSKTEADEKFQCKHCKKQYTRRDTLRRHILIYHSKSNSNLISKCKSCKKVFSNVQILNRHLETHKSPDQRKMFKCKLCDGRYSRIDSLNNHVAFYHSKSKEHLKKTCQVCGKQFLNTQLYKRHLETHKPSHQRPVFQCKLCNVGRYTRKDSLQRHMTLYHPKSKKTLKNIHEQD